MSDVDRYAFCNEILDVHPSGEWVRYDDYKALASRLEGSTTLARNDERIKRVCDRLESSDPEFDDCTDAVHLLVALQMELQAQADWKQRATDERLRRVGAESRLESAEKALREIASGRIDGAFAASGDMMARANDFLVERRETIVANSRESARIVSDKSLPEPERCLGHIDATTQCMLLPGHEGDCKP